VALDVLFFSAGLRTPLLALLALRRPRTLALVLIPFAPLIALSALLGPSLDPDGRVGLRALAVVPGLLFAPFFARVIGGRVDRSGALLAGTIAVAFLLNALAGPGTFGELQNGFLAFVVGAAVVATVPMLPAAVRMLGEVAGYGAFGALAVANVVSTAQGFDPLAFAAGTLMFVAAAVTAAITARLLRVEVTSALAASGSRDFGVATGLAIGAGGPGAAAAPQGFGIALLVVAVILVARNRRKAR
jgi:hypothetical protein